MRMRLTEAFFSTLKAEAFPSEQVFATKAEARRELFEYIEVYYNNQRLHSSLGYQTPRQYETSFNQVIDSRNGSPEVLGAASEDRAMLRTHLERRSGLANGRLRPPGGGLPAPAGASLKRKIPGSLRDGGPSSPTPRTLKKTNNCVSVFSGEVHLRPRSEPRPRLGFELRPAFGDDDARCRAPACAGDKIRWAASRWMGIH
jgi:integrase-like protein